MYMYKRAYIRTYINAHTYVRTYIYVYLCMCVRVRACVDICTPGKKNPRAWHALHMGQKRSSHTVTWKILSANNSQKFNKHIFQVQFSTVFSNLGDFVPAHILKACSSESPSIGWVLYRICSL